VGEARPPEPRTAQNELPDAFWEPLGHQSPEQLKISLQRPSGSHLATRAQNSSKATSGSHVATRAQNATAFPGFGGHGDTKITFSNDQKEY